MRGEGRGPIWLERAGSVPGTGGNLPEEGAGGGADVISPAAAGVGKQQVWVEGGRGRGAGIDSRRSRGGMWVLGQRSAGHQGRGRGQSCGIPGVAGSHRTQSRSPMAAGAAGAVQGAERAPRPHPLPPPRLCAGLEAAGYAPSPSHPLPPPPHAVLLRLPHACYLRLQGSGVGRERDLLGEGVHWCNPASKPWDSRLASAPTPTGTA